MSPNSGRRTRTFAACVLLSAPAAGADGILYPGADRDGSILRLRRVAAPGQ